MTFKNNCILRFTRYKSIMASKQALCKGLNLIKNGPITTLQMDNQKNYNALTTDMYKNIANQLNTLSDCKDTRVICLTGSNGCYSSGNDLSSFGKILGPGIPKEQMMEKVQGAADLCEEFVSSFINCKQPLVAKVDGMSIGISCTSLGLCDFVYASERSWFYTPFTKIAQGPEGCSSVIFPQIMGNSKAREILYLNKKINAQQAFERNLVTEVFASSEELDAKVDSVLNEFSVLPPRSVKSAKALVEGFRREMLLEVNKKECENLVARFSDLEELGPVIKDFFNKSKKK